MHTDKGLILSGKLQIGNVFDLNGMPVSRSMPFVCWDGAQEVRVEASYGGWNASSVVTSDVPPEALGGWVALSRNIMGICIGPLWGDTGAKANGKIRGSGLIWREHGTTVFGTRS